MDKEATDNFKEFVDQLLNMQLSTMNQPPATWAPKRMGIPVPPVPPLSVEEPYDLLGELYLTKDGDLYFHPTKAGKNYDHDIFIKTVDDIKKIKTKRLLKT